MFKSVLDFLTSQIPVARWIIFLLMLGFVVDIAVILSHLQKRKIGEE